MSIQLASHSLDEGCIHLCQVPGQEAGCTTADTSQDAFGLLGLTKCVTAPFLIKW